MLDRWTVGMKTVAGALLVAGPIAAGSAWRPVGVAALYVLSFVLAQALSGRDLWVSQVEEKGRGVIAPMVCATFFVQAIVVAVLFFIGRLIATVGGIRRPIGGGAGLVTLGDVLTAGCLCAAAICLREIARARRA